MNRRIYSRANPILKIRSTLLVGSELMFWRVSKKKLVIGGKQLKYISVSRYYLQYKSKFQN